MLESSCTGSRLAVLSCVTTVFTSVAERPQNCSLSGSASALAMNVAAAKSDSAYQSLNGLVSLSFAIVPAIACHTASSSPSAFGGGQMANAVTGVSAARIINAFIFIVIVGVFMGAEITQTKNTTPHGTRTLRTASATHFKCAEFFSCHLFGARRAAPGDLSFFVH